MKNLKRVLSLGLASVMLLGMMVVGASAKDFTDAEDIQHTDAVQTLVALNVIKGKEDGSYFDPKGSVTRGEMAKMIAVAMNGGNEEAPGVKMTPTFTDISGHWAEPFIEYCADMGIISGRGDGTFDPNGNVTGLEVAKMVLTALGYNSEAYQLTGASWAVRTNEVAKTAYPKGLYEELNGVSMNAPATRDTSAQLIWNGLISNVVTIQPVADKQSTGLEWSYGVDKTTLLLKQRYNAETVEGIYMGNSKSISGLPEGEIRVVADNGTNSFPCDLGIENIGEEVRIVWKDGTRGTPGKADKQDTIYGCFNTGRSQVYNITKNDIQDAKSDASNHIKFGDELHEAETSITVVTDYVGAGTATPIATINGNGASQWRGWQNVDKIKFVCDPDDGKIDRAFVTTMRAGKISGITSSKITISGLGTIDIDKNDIYDDVAKDDVVVYTRFYNNSDLDKAFVTVEKAEVVEGQLTGFKLDGSKYINVVVDGDTYKVESKLTAIQNLTDDAITAPVESNIGDSVAAYLMDGMVVALQQVDASGGKYALVTDSNNSSGDVGSNIKGGKVRVLLPDGTSETVYVHKDSKKDNQSTPTALVNTSDLPIGTLIEYSSLNNGTIKVKTTAKSDNVTNVTYADYGTVTGTSSTPATIWDKDSKTLTYAAGSSKVAAADAVLFVCRRSSGSATAADTFKAYSLRDLGTIKTDTSLDVAVYEKDGLIKAAYVMLPSLPKATGANTYYGIVSSFVGTRKIDDTEYHQYKVAVNADEQIVINVEAAGDTLAEKDIVTFGERSDGLYENADFDKLAAYNSSTKTVDVTANATAIAVKSYNDAKRLLTYYQNTGRASIKEGFVGSNPDSYTVDKDVKIVYINANDKKDGESIGVNSFNGNTGYANALITVNDDGLVDAIIVETSEKVNWDGTNFGVTPAMTLPAAPTATTANSSNAVYTVTMSPAAGANAPVGSTVTITIKCTTVPDAGKTDTFTLDADANIEDISGAVTFDEHSTVNSTKTITFKVKTTTAATLTLSAS